MTNVLRKKIALSTGIPPSVQNAEQFWQRLRSAANGWALEATGIAAETNIVRREVLVGEHVTSDTDGNEVSFSMHPYGSFGLSAVVLSRGLSLNCAALRMQQDVVSLDGSSNLFLELICEDPAMLLRESIKAHLNGSRHDFAKGVGIDLTFTQTALQPSVRYLKVEIELPVEEQVERIKLLFDFVALKKYLASYDAGIENAGPASGASKYGLLHKSVQKSEIRLDGVLERIEMSFGDCSRLKVGQIVSLATASQSSIAISVDTLSGSTDISHGTLGVWKQNRAIKLRTPVSEDFVRDLAGF